MTFNVWFLYPFIEMAMYYSSDVKSMASVCLLQHSQLTPCHATVNMSKVEDNADENFV